MNIIEIIKDYVINESNNYKDNSMDHYDYWNEHIKYVYEEAIKLANIYNADIEIVSLGALLHDIALICKIGSRKDHHINGKLLAEQILTKYNYDKNKLDRVLGCVLNHRSSKNATNNEELCVADADILAHFDNIPMIINNGLNIYKIKKEDINKWLLDGLEEEYNDLSDRTKLLFKDRYDKIINDIKKVGDNYGESI